VNLYTCAAVRLGCRRGERRLELSACRDSEFREDAVEVGADGAVGQVEPLANLAVGESLRCKLCDLEFLGGQLIAGGRIATPARLP
jgi:hypothetical protein